MLLDDITMVQHLHPGKVQASDGLLSDFFPVYALSLPFPEILNYYFIHLRSFLPDPASVNFRVISFKIVFEGGTVPGAEGMYPAVHQEDLLDGIKVRFIDFLIKCPALAIIKVDHPADQIILIFKFRVEGFFGNSQLSGNILHGYTSNSVRNKKRQYPFQHISHFLHVAVSFGNPGNLQSFLSFNKGETDREGKCSKYNVKLLLIYLKQIFASEPENT